MKKKKFSKSEQNLRNWLLKGGRKDSKKDFVTLLKRAIQPAK